MRVYVINLKRETKRRAFMQTQLDRLGWQYEFIEATDGSMLSETDTATLYDQAESLKHIKVPLRKNEIACAHSHRQVYKKILTDKETHALVLEDDVVLDPKLINILTPDFLSQQSFDWLQIDYPPSGVRFLHNWLRGSLLYSKKNPAFFLYALLKAPYILILTGYEIFQNWRYKNKPTAVRRLRPIYLASAYIITPTGINKLMPLAEPILFAADMLPNKARLQSNLLMKVLVPLYTYQDRKQFPSNIGDR